MIDNYRDLPLGVYEQICSVEDTEREDIDKQVAVLSLLSGMPERDILNLPLPEYREMSGKAEFLRTPPEALPRVADAYLLGGFKLKPTKDLRKITAAQYIDFQSLAPDGDKRLVELLSVFLVPEGYKYGDGYDVLDVHAALRAEMNVADALAVTAFFLDRYASLIRSTATSLERMMRSEKDPKRRMLLMVQIGEMERAWEALLTAGAGSAAWTR